MKENQKKNKGRRWGWWILGAVVVIAGLLIGLQIVNNRRAEAATLANLETEPYQRRTLDSNIFGTGTVQPSQTALLTWSNSGTVGEVNVSLGEAVEKDQVLLSLDPDSVSVDILQARVDLINAQNALDDLNANWESDLAQAKLDLLNAENDLDDLETDRKIMNYERCTDERIEELEDELAQAERFYAFKSDSDALQALNTAQANLNFCNADFTEEEIAEAELKVQLGEAKVADLQKRVDTLTLGPDPDQVTILETQLAIAQKRADSLLIKAPFDGVVTVLPAQTGDVVQAGTQAIQLDDLSNFYLDVQISEVDIPKVSVGQQAQLVFDAYFEETFTGEVTQIAPVGSTVQGVVEYPVRIKMDDGDGQIRSGMTASVSIVVEEKKDVFVISNNALVIIDGQETVFVKRNGTYVAVPISLGSYSDTYSEVLSGDIEPGEPIILNPPSDLTGENPFGSGPPSQFGGFGN